MSVPYVRSTNPADADCLLAVLAAAHAHMDRLGYPPATRYSEMPTKTTPRKPAA